jgi:hypothetical protein
VLPHNYGFLCVAMAPIRKRCERIWSQLLPDSIPQIVALSLTSFAEFVEPVIMQALAWGEAGTSQVRDCNNLAVLAFPTSVLYLPFDYC